MLKGLKEKLDKGGEVYLRVKVKPGMGKTEMLSVMEDNTLKINIKAVPEKGKANVELIRFIAKEFHVLKEHVKIISGASDRIKLVKIKK